MTQNGIQRGQAITFRIPSDTPDHILRQLQNLKETERRNFSSTIADYVIKGVSQSMAKERETISIPLPKQLNKAQRDWVKHEYSEALLGSILYQLISDPVRSSALLASFNSNALDINEALYLQENDEASSNQESEPEIHEDAYPQQESASANEGEPSSEEQDTTSTDEDLDNLDWESLSQDISSDSESEEDEEVSYDDVLGGFLDKLNQ
ncbi:hypothetical protein [Pontibacillus yanchengensis]|uniref:Uncharacterized protein n=1 Tax=Pontibacillus yanchengensis Y32 TaxID=1385514 RepID=A0A0A2TEW0_9BACI|nr:hypothetical protein [Pontibacillus yanchengensis]KGP74109.1 hypothetical protein N782_17410 [Pontibacillus yanchengensis Y32]